MIQGEKRQKEEGNWKEEREMASERGKGDAPVYDNPHYSPRLWTLDLMGYGGLI